MLKKLICIGYVIILASTFCGCSEDRDIKEYNKEIGGITTEKNDLHTDDSEKAELSELILGEWKPVSAKNQNGEDISLQEIWGSGISYGGTLKTYEDGNYTEYIGIIGETDPLEGTWKINDSQIILTSKTNLKKNVTVINENVIDIDYGDKIVRFERKNILEGVYAIPDSDVFWAFSKDGKVSQSGNIHVDIGTYKVTKEDVIEIHYTTKKVWNDENGNVEINDIDIYEYISVDDNNVYLMNVDGSKSKLERYRDVTKEDFE